MAGDVEGDFAEESKKGFQELVDDPPTSAATDLNHLLKRLGPERSELMHERLLLASLRASTGLYEATWLECNLIAENLEIGSRIVRRFGEIFVVGHGEYSWARPPFATTTAAPVWLVVASVGWTVWMTARSSQDDGALIRSECCSSGQGVVACLMVMSNLCLLDQGLI